MSVILSNLLTADRIALHQPGGSKKLLLERLSELLATAATPTDLEPTQILSVLLERERLGSTAIGHGIAIPHARIAGLEHPIAALLSTTEASDFDALDDQPVNLFIALLAPENTAEQHLQCLAEIVTLLSNTTVVAELKTTTNVDTVLEHFTRAPHYVD